MQNLCQHPESLWPWASTDTDQFQIPWRKYLSKRNLFQRSRAKEGSARIRREQQRPENKPCRRKNQPGKIFPERRNFCRIAGETGRESTNTAHQLINSSDELINSRDESINKTVQLINWRDELINKANELINKTAESINKTAESIDSSDELINLIGHSIRKTDVLIGKMGESVNWRNESIDSRALLITFSRQLINSTASRPVCQQELPVARPETNPLGKAREKPKPLLLGAISPAKW